MPSCDGHQFDSCIPANRRGFRVGRNPRNFGRLARRVAVCEPNSHRSHAFCAEFARQSQPAKFRFPDHEMERPDLRLRVRQIERGGTICSEWIAVPSVRRVRPAPEFGCCSPRARHCSDQSIGRSVRRLTQNPRGRRPSIAASARTGPSAATATSFANLAASRGPCHPPLDEGLIVVTARAMPARKPSVKIKVASTIRALPSPCPTESWRWTEKRSEFRALCRSRSWVNLG